MAHVLKSKPGRLLTIDAESSVREAVGILKEHKVSQLPVLDSGGRHCGVISEIDLLNHLVDSAGDPDTKLDTLISSDYATVTPHTRIQLLKHIFNDAKVVLVVEDDKAVGILTKIDLIDYLSQNRHT